MTYHFNPEERLTLDKIQEIIDKKMTLALSEEAKRRIEKCRNYLNQKMENQKVPIYGVTTGFGSLCNISISKEQLSQLQKNLVMSHACGVGDEVPAEVVRLMLLLKAQNFCFGYSGAQLQTPPSQPDAPRYPRYGRRVLERPSLRCAGGLFCQRLAAH